MPIPENPKIYHIVHVDRLPSIIRDGYLWCDAKMVRRGGSGTTIGMNKIKQRRLTNALNSHSNLHVGDCVPFYFCPRSVMLYIIHQANHPELAYCGGQDPIVHLETDLQQTVAWANQKKLCWAFTTSNASASYAEDWCDLAKLNEIDWNAVQATRWQRCKEGKQAEFLIEDQFPWPLVSRIGVLSNQTYQQTSATLVGAKHKPPVEIRRQWYY